MIDREVVQEKMGIVERDLAVAREIGKQDVKTFSGNYRDVLAAKHALLESIEACLDIASHLIAEKAFRKPQDYKDMFKVLEENRIIPAPLYERLAEMSKFRNLLVHRYADIESKRLHYILNHNLSDMEDFLRAVLVFLKKKG